MDPSSMLRSPRVTWTGLGVLPGCSWPQTLPSERERKNDLAKVKNPTASLSNYLQMLCWFIAKAESSLRTGPACHYSVLHRLVNSSESKCSTSYIRMIAKV